MSKAHVDDDLARGAVVPHLPDERPCRVCPKPTELMTASRHDG
jgi:hypothetical protein